MPGISGTYSEKLLALKLLSLKDRRMRGDMIQTYKIVNKIDYVDPDAYFKFTSNQHDHATRQAAAVTTTSVEPTFCLSEGPCRLDLRRYFFTQRVVYPWNALLPNVHLANSVCDFKIKYDNVMALANQQ